MDIHSIKYVRTIYPDKYHCHQRSFEFHFCVEGRTVYRAADSYLDFTPGVLILAAPGEWHQLLMDGEKPVSFYYLLFKVPPEYRELLSRLQAKFSRDRCLLLRNHFRSVFETIKRKTNSGNEFQAKAARHQFIALLYDLLARRLYSPRDPQAKIVDEAIAFMQTSLTRQLSLDELAGVVKRNKSYFIRTFKARMELPPLKYFNKLKIETACYLLKENKLTLGDIAAYLAFYDEFHFSHVFKQFLGISPGKYRKENSLPEKET